MRAHVHTDVAVVDRTRDAGTRVAVIDYYDHCRNDYRILWRTEENGSIHFGFFDSDQEPPGVGRALQWLASLWACVIGAVAALAAMCAALTATTAGHDQAVRYLKIAARGRAARHDAAQRRMTEVCADEVGLRPGERVLDAGCGVGGTGLWLVSHRGVTLLGLNLQRAQLAEARDRAAADPAGRRMYVSVQDYTQMGVADGAVDVVWGLESICHCDDKRAFIREAYRVLRPGGRLMVADFLLPARAPAAADPRVEAWIRGWAIPHLADVRSFHTELAAHEFQDIRYRDIGRHVWPSSRRLYKAALVARPVDWVLQQIGARSPVQRENVRAAYWQYRTLRDGAWTYGIFVATKGGRPLPVSAGQTQAAAGPQGLPAA